jgi:hypothetical protein
MKHLLKLNFALALFALLVTGAAVAESEKKMVIAIKTDHSELAQTDISELAVGEAKTIQTDSGKVIDIIRTADGAEVYMDGALVEMDFDHDGLHDEHMVRKHVKVICEDGEDCDKHIVMHTEDDIDLAEWMAKDSDHVIIHKEIELSCSDDESGTNCSESTVLISDTEEMDIEELHELHKDGEAYKVIVVKKEIDSTN